MASPRLNGGRWSDPGKWYVITTVTRERIPFLTDPALAQATAAQIQSIAIDAAETHAWVVMPEHLHWMIQLGSTVGLSQLIQMFKSKSAIAINRLRGSSGTVWQPGFYDHRLRNDEDFAAQARYIVANPVRRGIVQRIEEYPHWWCRWIANGADMAM